MPLPRSIQAQVDSANATLEAMNKPPVAPEDSPPEVAPQPEPSFEAPQQQAPEPQAPAPVVRPPQVDEEETWQQRYRTLQGHFNKEVPSLQHQVKELKAQLEKAVTRLDTATAQASKPPEPKPAADPSDVDNFGSDLVEMVQRTAERMYGTAAREMQAQVAQFTQRLEQLEQGLQGTTQVVAATAEDSFFMRLTKLVPDWETVNANQAFLDWLAAIDPVYGTPRQSALSAARADLDAERTAAVFRAFTGQLAHAASAPPLPKAVSVERQVSPKGAAVPAAAATPDKPVFSEAQVVKFYDAKRRGEYRGQEAEAQRIEQLINLAIAEGRVR